jgi:hypothetical protein
MEIRKNIPNYATYTLVGSFAFWLPSVILHAVKGDDYFRHLTVLAYVQVFSTVGALVSNWFLRGWIVPPRRIAPWLLLGIWVLGPFWLSVNATFDGGGFAKEGGWLAVIVSIFGFPVMTPLLAVYDGSIPNLLMITLLLGLVCLDLRAILSSVRRLFLKRRARPEISA